MSPSTSFLLTGSLVLLAQASVLLLSAAATFWKSFGPRPQLDDDIPVNHSQTPRPAFA